MRNDDDKDPTPPRAPTEQDMLGLVDELLELEADVRAIRAMSPEELAARLEKHGFAEEAAQVRARWAARSRK